MQNRTCFQHESPIICTICFQLQNTRVSQHYTLCPPGNRILRLQNKWETLIHYFSIMKGAVTDCSFYTPPNGLTCTQGHQTMGGLPCRWLKFLLSAFYGFLFNVMDHIFIFAFKIGSPLLFFFFPCRYLLMNPTIRNTRYTEDEWFQGSQQLLSLPTRAS